MQKKYPPSAGNVLTLEYCGVSNQGRKQGSLPPNYGEVSVRAIHHSVTVPKCEQERCLGPEIIAVTRHRMERGAGSIMREDTHLWKIKFLV